MITTSGRRVLQVTKQVIPKHNKDYLEYLSVHLDFEMCKVDEKSLSSFP